MEQLEQNILRFKDPAMALVGGTGAALVIATLPHVYLETIVGLTGLSEIVSAAAPPLGNTARALIAVMAGLVSASAIYFFLNRKGGSDMSVALREQINASNPVDPDYDPSAEDNKRRFSMPKLSIDAKSLTRFLKKPKRNESGPKKVMNLTDLPMLRETDAHPDAPARRPIFAESDLKSPLADQIQPLELENEQPFAAPEETIAPAQFSVDRSIVAPVEQQPATEAASVGPEPVVQQIEPPEAVQQAQDLSGLSIAQLADRLEAGLVRLNQLEVASRDLESLIGTPDVSVAAPQPETATAPPPLKPVEKTEEQIHAERQADMDAALKAALGTLEKMTAQR